MILRRLGAGLVGAALSLLTLPALAAEAAPEPTPYLNGFCLSVVAGASGVEALRERLQAFSARPAPSGAADAARPQGVEVAGQLFRFAETGAPDAFVDQRRGDCALVYAGAALPGTAMDELSRVKLPVGPEGAPVPWRLVTQTFAGRPRPAKYFLQMGDREGFGVCAEINNDLRRRDQSPAAMVQLYNCRIGKDERLGDNG
jgi:hypothetical protein